MKLTPTESKFLADTIYAWAQSQPCVAGVPLMYTDATGERCLLAQDEIEALFQRLAYNR